MAGRRGTQFCWLIFSLESDLLAGSIAARKDENGVSLGYLLARSHWGDGLMAEAIPAVVRWTFSDPSVFRVWAVCDVEKSNLGTGARKDWICL